MKLFLFMCCFSLSKGFLVDQGPNGNTPAPSHITDSHFTTLLNLLVEERQAREQLEHQVQQLQQTMTNKDTVQSQCKCLHINDNSLDDLKMETATQKGEIQTLKLTLEELRTQNRKMLDEQSRTNATLSTLNAKISNLEQLKGIANLQNILQQIGNVTHRTDIMEGSLKSVISDSQARAQDFVGLLNQIKSDEQKSAQNFDRLTNLTENKITATKNELEAKVNLVEDMLHNSTRAVDSEIKDLTTRLGQMSNGTALRSCSNSYTAPSGAIIKFPYVVFSNHVSNTALASFQRNGKFVVEEAGVYLISVSISTDTNTNSFFEIYKNGGRRQYVYWNQHTTTYYTTASMTTIERLDKNDEIYIQNGGEMLIDGGGSCFNIIQII